MTTKSEGGIASAVSYAAEHPHAVAAFGSNTMTYDKNGNMTYASGPDVASSYAFDPENRMAISRSGAFIKTYLYDGMGELVRRSRWHVWYAPGTNDMRDTFVDGIYEEQNGPTTPFVATTQTSCSPPAKITKYYTAFGRVIATRVNGVLSYNLVDHLGSTVQQIDSTNTPGPAIKYFPFGAPRNGTTSPERAFTGQQREDDSPLGMYYYHARFYSSVLGHFMSADPKAGGTSRYAYVHGHPLNRIDPTGYSAECALFDPCANGLAASYRLWKAQADYNFNQFSDYIENGGFGQVLPPSFGGYFGTAPTYDPSTGEVAGQFYVRPGAGSSQTVLGLKLTAGYLIAYSAASILNGHPDIGSVIQQGGTVVVNSHTLATDAYGQVANFVQAAAALLALNNGYLHYTSIQNAHAIVNSRTPTLYAGERSGGLVYLSRFFYTSASQAEVAIGIDDARAVIGLTTDSLTSPGLGRLSNGQILPLSPLEYVAISPVSIHPAFIGYLDP